MSAHTFLPFICIDLRKFGLGYYQGSILEKDLDRICLDPILAHSAYTTASQIMTKGTHYATIQE